MARGKVTAVGPRKRNDVYVAMLVVSLLALGGACGLLFSEWGEYGQESPPKEKLPPLPALTDKGGTK